VRQPAARLSSAQALRYRSAMRPGLALVVLLAGPTLARADSPARWERRADMGTPRQEIGVAAIGDTLYAIGGFAGTSATNVVEAYDVAADRWRTVAPLPAALHHVVAAAVGGTLYAVGGLAGGGSTAVDTTFAYDPAADLWTPRASLPAGRGASGVAVIDGRIYVAGGLRGGASVDDFTAYDPAADSWRVLPAMPTARDHLAAGAVDGRFYAVGGRAGSQLFAATEVFDPAAGAWRTGLARMPTARGGLAAAALGGRLFAFGGEGNAGNPLGIFPQTEAYDPARDTWLALPDMGVPRHGTAAVAVGGGIYVVGGATRQGLGVSGASEVFVPPSGDVLSVGRLVARGGGRMVLRGVLLDAAADPSTLPLRLRVLDGERELFGLATPAGSLVANRRGTRWRLRRFPRTAGPRFERIVLRRRTDGLAVRLRAVGGDVPPPPASLTVVLELGERSFCGSARLGRR
jgi:N-acetylneuraminic acid mutarotase